MLDTQKTAEDLHVKAKKANVIANQNWVNPGTVTTPLATLDDLANPETSKDATTKLRTNLIKG